jgi:serine/threonine protein kinase/Tol biopolymer transport system component
MHSAARMQHCAQPDATCRIALPLNRYNPVRMPLNSGTKLGPYEILAPIGAGGMGEVYRARDTRLDRTVAVKVLPQHLADTPDARQRFEREARAVSALNHPNICTLHDVGSQDGTEYIVMECLEGETLASRLEKGALPLNQALKIGIEVADALDKAHRAGIIHRDLKPGNIMLTKSGAKLLDFGLAKATLRLAGGATLSALAAPTTPITQQGLIVGTFQYMSPEQVEAKELDARSDIFSLGSVLYEMLTGKAAFQGRSQLSVASAILEKDPEPINTLQPMTPPALDRTVRKCLEKDPDNRWQTARDLLLELKWIASAGSQARVPAPVVSHRKNRERIAWIVAAVLALATIAATIGYIQRASKPTQPIHVIADLGTDAFIPAMNYGTNAILSPDGTHMALVAVGAGKRTQLYVRSLDQLQATLLIGTEDARNPFFSPDSRWIAFFSEGKLKKISIQGGAPVTLCDVPDDRGGTWGDDGTIVFSPSIRRAGLSRVSSAGGTPETLTKIDPQKGEDTHRWPQFLPGGKDVLFTAALASGNFDDADIDVYSIASGKRKTILHGGSYARYLPSGHLIYMHNGTLFAVPFDVKRLEVTGQPAPVVEGVAANPDTGGAQFSASDSGTLLYIAGSPFNKTVSIYWMDAAGKYTPLREASADYANLAISPDGKRLAMDISNAARTDVWVYDWERDTLTRLTFAATFNGYPVWTPDGQRITYTSLEKGGVANLWWIRSDGAGDAQRLTDSKYTQAPGSWSPDGKTLAFYQLSPDTNFDIFTMPVEGDEKSGWKPGTPKPFVNTPFLEVLPTFSPDGRWIAYASNESGSNEVYVRPFPRPGGRWQISTGGGDYPQWSRNGKELFYRTRDQKIMVVGFTSSNDSFRADKPRLWSPGQLTDRGTSITFSLHPDGKRFAVLKPPGSEATAPVINKASFIFNFFDELRTKVPSGKN